MAFLRNIKSDVWQKWSRDLRLLQIYGEIRFKRAECTKMIMGEYPTSTQVWSLLYKVLLTRSNNEKDQNVFNQFIIIDTLIEIFIVFRWFKWYCD